MAGILDLDKLLVRAVDVVWASRGGPHARDEGLELSQVALLQLVEGARVEATEVGEGGVGMIVVVGGRAGLIGRSVMSHEQWDEETHQDSPCRLAYRTPCCRSCAAQSPGAGTSWSCWWRQRSRWRSAASWLRSCGRSGGRETVCVRRKRRYLVSTLCQRRRGSGDSIVTAP